MLETRDSAIQHALDAFEPDARVLAMWVEGSVGRGTADQWSDVDLHLAVADDSYEEFGRSASDLLGRIAPPLGYLDSTIGGVRIIAATLSGPARVDLYLERRASVRTTPRHPGHRIVFDRDEVVADLSAAPAPHLDSGPFLQTLIRAYFFGGMWPARMWGRRDWGGLLMNDTGVVYQFVVPALLIADGSPEFYREPHNRARFLAPARRAQVNALLADALEAFRGIEDDAVDEEQLRGFHARFLAAVWGAFREACRVSGTPYPDASEREYRAYFERERGIEVLPFE